MKSQGLTLFQRRDILEEKDFITQPVNEYAAKKEKEFFAAYVMSDKPRKAAQIFGEIIDNILRR